MKANELLLGWNLGNTLDAPDGETTWGMPYTTREIISAVKDMGFDTVRIPVSWHKHVTAAPDYRIDGEWLCRVGEVVDYALGLGMNAIINSHHDNGVYTPTPSNAERAKGYLSAVWRQVAEYFRYYGEGLIFQTMNEPRVEGAPFEWWVDTSNSDCVEALGVINLLNQAAVDAIRAGGGKNAERYILVSPYAANLIGALTDEFKLPLDPSGRLMVSVHSYSPYNLCLNTSLEHREFHEKDRGEIISMMEKIRAKYVSRGVPVIIDEMGCMNKENDEVRREWADFYASAAREYGVSLCWWDNGTVATGTEGFGILDRRQLCVFSQSRSVLRGLVKGFRGEG